MSAAARDSRPALEREHAPLVALLAARGAEQVAHPGGSLQAHLERTARRLQAWGAAAELVAAGRCHAAYGTAGFPSALFTLAERELLRRQIGDDAEAIVYAYCACDREPPNAADDELRDRFSGEYVVPSARLRRQLAELTAANELDVAEHTHASPVQLAAIHELVRAASPSLSQAAWSALHAAPSMQGALLDAAPPAGDCELAYRDLGAHGERVLLWHGGAAPELTWARQHALSAELQLRIPWRRGFAPSVLGDRQDWEPDVRDLLRVMPERAHVVAHSYGAVSALLAAGTAPERFASLTLIEPPLWAIAPEDAEVQAMAALGRAFASGAADARSAFLAMAALPERHPQTLRTERLARNFRDPGEAVPDLTALRGARAAIAVVSGDHCAALERLCDSLGHALAAERWVLPGAGHAVARTPAFNARLRDLIAHSPY